MRRCYHFRTRILSLLAIAAAGLTASMQAVPAQETAVKPIKALLVLGGCCHDYKTQQDILSKGSPRVLASKSPSPTIPTPPTPI